MMDFDQWYERTAALLLESDLPQGIVEGFLTDHQKVRQLFADDFAPAEVLMHLRRQYRLAKEQAEKRVAERSSRPAAPGPARPIVTASQRKRKAAREAGQQLIRKSSGRHTGEYIANLLLFICIGVFTAFVIGLVLWAMME